MRPFERIRINKPARAAFDLSEERKTTCNMGELIPVMCKEVLPGDTFNVDFEAFLRTQPLIAPVMHRINMYAHCFFVPMRLLLAPGVWEKFITQSTGAPAKLPHVVTDGFYTSGYQPVKGDLLDHLQYGMKLGSRGRSGEISQMPLRAYHRIWNDYYRDQNLQTEYDVTTLADSYNNNIPTALVTVRKRAWEKDYFTSCLPTPQRGSEQIAPLYGYVDTVGKHIRTSGVPLVLTQASNQAALAAGTPTINASGEIIEYMGSDKANVQSGLETNLAASGVGAKVSEIRRAFALQRWYEASMRFGQRYVEQLLGLFGVVSSDARLQRAEYLAGGKIPVQIGEVLQTSETGTSVQGNMSGKGLSVGNITGFNRTFDEHGYIMTIVSVMPRTAYMNTCVRQNIKTSVWDFAFPQLANLTEQPVYKAELGQDLATPTAPFGYQPQYEEYRFGFDTVHGDFRDTLKWWSIAREVAAAPALNESFITCTPSTFIWPAAFQNNQLILQTFSKVEAIRPLPKFGQPI